MSEQKPKETRHPVIAVEGAIGAGKSTFLRWVRAEYAADGHVVGDEYVSHLMPRYYSNERRWALATQIDSLVGRVYLGRAALNVARESTVWLDRSVYGDLAFARANHATKRISPEEYRIYMDARDALTLPQVDAVLWLDTPRAVCEARRRARSTMGEFIPYDYEEALSAAYKDVLADAESRGVRVFRAGWGAHLVPHTEDYSRAARHLLRVFAEFLGAPLSAEGYEPQ